MLSFPSAPAIPNTTIGSGNFASDRPPMQLRGWAENRAGLSVPPVDARPSGDQLEFFENVVERFQAPLSGAGR